MTLLSVVKVERRPPYNDIYFGPGLDGDMVETHREPSPVVASYELAVEMDGQRRTFGAEVRSGRGDSPQIDFDDALSDLMSERGLSDNAWSAVASAIFAAHSGSVDQLPLDLHSPPPGP